MLKVESFQKGKTRCKNWSHYKPNAEYL